MISDVALPLQRVEISTSSVVLLKRVSEVRILFGTPPQNTAILTSCGVFLLLV
nr:MAG TPA: hypothetical protein [Caudoviricetes sp.]